jgi:beta-N-acetylhexosaminidase
MIRGRAAAVALVAALVAAGLLVQAGGTGAVPTRTVPKPPIVWKPIVFGAKRKAEMRAYAIRHYGIASWRLTPHVIVEHYTADESFSSTYNYFAGDTPDVELGELPGVCSHFVIDKDGTIYQLVALTIMCATRSGSTTRRSGSSTSGRATARSSETRASSVRHCDSRSG